MSNTVTKLEITCANAVTMSNTVAKYVEVLKLTLNLHHIRNGFHHIRDRFFKFFYVFFGYILFESCNCNDDLIEEKLCNKDSI